MVTPPLSQCFGRLGPLCLWSVSCYYLWGLSFVPKCSIEVSLGRADGDPMCLVEAHEEAGSQVAELNLKLDLALYRAEEVKVWAEEASDETTIAEDMATESIMKSKHKIKTLHRVASKVGYKFGYQITIRCFKAKYPKLDVDKDPFVELPSDAKVPTSMEVPFDDRPMTPPALPPPS
ncbi:hypothetical protein BHE74_00021172 [Ensete ventricosum]|nr:hypothetical protein BHE74_00021172 [Ensete ventricosum]